MTEDKTSHQCHMAFISMTLGIFVLVCSAVIAGTLVSTALNDNIAAEELTKAISTYEDIGSIMYALGDELVSSVAVNSDEEADVGNMIVAQKITNKVSRKVKENLTHRWLRSTSYIVDEIEEGREFFRESLAWNEPLPAIKAYLNLSQWIFQNCMEIDYISGLRSRVVAYLVFVKGMSERFGEMSLGIAYVKTDIPVNGAELLRLRVGSDESLQIAFNFEPEVRSMVEHLNSVHNATEMVVDDILTQNIFRNNQEFSPVYMKAVKEETARLFLAKEMLNNTLHFAAKDASDRAQRKLYFNLTTVIVSVAALILCLIFSVVSRATTNRQRETTASREMIYHHF